MLGFLSLGLVIGMTHALEADHLAAMGAMAKRGGAGRRRLAWLGASWGLGHTTTLFLLSLPALLLGAFLTTRVEAGLEFAVGLMLMVLGADAILQMRLDRGRFDLPDHGDGARRFHACSRRSATAPHDADRRDHDHAPLFSRRSYLVGLMHGAAGSAGLVAAAAAASQDLGVTLLYILLFGIGSTLGMAILTLIASWPLARAEASAGRAFTILQGAMACGAILVGMGMAASAAPVILEAG